jgi:hypothetical protein
VSVRGEEGERVLALCYSVSAGCFVGEEPEPSDPCTPACMKVASDLDATNPHDESRSSKTCIEHLPDLGHQDGKPHTNRDGNGYPKPEYPMGITR